jgi:hypothetical protein
LVGATILAYVAVGCRGHSAGHNESRQDSPSERDTGWFISLAGIPSGPTEALVKVVRYRMGERGTERCAFVSLPGLALKKSPLRPCPEGSIWSGNGKGRFIVLMDRPYGLRIYEAKPSGWKTAASLSWKSKVHQPTFSPSGGQVLLRYDPDEAAVWDEVKNTVTRLRIGNPRGGRVTKFFGWANDDYIVRTVDIVSSPQFRTAIQVYDARSGRVVKKTDFPGLISLFSRVPGGDEVAAFGDDGRSLYIFSIPQVRLARRVGLPPEFPARGLYPYFVGPDSVLYFSGESPVETREFVRFSLASGQVDWVIKNSDNYDFLLLHLLEAQTPDSKTVALVGEYGPSKSADMPLNHDVRFRTVSVKDGKVLATLTFSPSANGDSATLRFGDGTKTRVSF